MNAVTVVEEAAIEGTQPETVVSKASHVDERGAEASASPASSAAAQDTLDASKSGTAVEAGFSSVRHFHSLSGTLKLTRNVERNKMQV
jgi:hypothetical protein